MLKRHHFIAVSFLLGFTQQIYSQKSFEAVRNALHFNVFKHQPDSSILPFVRKYFPEFARPFVPSEWTIYSPDSLPPAPRHDVAKHVFVFTEHPHVPFKFREGNIIFKSYDGDTGPPQFNGSYLIFFFDDEREGQAGFDFIADLFVPVSHHVLNYHVDNRPVIKFFPTSDESDFVQVVLVKDWLTIKGYQVIISPLDFYRKD